MRYLPLILFIAVVVSCGKKDTSEEPEEEEVTRIDGSNVQGVYQTPLKAMNVNTTLGKIGSAGLHRSSDSFKAFVKLYIGDKGVVHRQSIHHGSRCPTLDDDINGDGYIDEREVFFAVGNIILPLDGDLTTQNGGSNSYPVGNGMAGGYFYERTTSFEKMFDDLRDTDNNTLDEVDKIPYNEGVTFNLKVILIYGTGTALYLPDSVSTMGNRSRAQSLPIACGVLSRGGRFPSELFDRSDPLTQSHPLPRPRITPRTPGHEEPPGPVVVTPLPDPDPPRTPGWRQRFRRWWRTHTGGDDSNLL